MFALPADERGNDLILTFFHTWGQQLYSTFVEQQRYLMLLDGFKNTLIITFGALLIGIVLGTTVAVIKFLAARRAALRPLAWLCNLYVTVDSWNPCGCAAADLLFCYSPLSGRHRYRYCGLWYQFRRLHGGDHPRAESPP